MLFYRLLSWIGLALYFPYAAFRSVAGKRRLGDLRGRLGWAPYPDLSGGIWIHAVSVGEVGVARSLLESLTQAIPDRRLGLSVTTAAGRRLAEESAGRGVAVFAFPLDLAGPVEKALSAVKPDLVVLTETEIWPLFLDRAAQRGVSVALVNGRVSSRSLARYRLAGRFFSRVLERICLFAMQTEEDAQRILALGAPGDRVCVTGNIKYDRAAALPFPDAARLKQAAAGRSVVVAASTGEGEEDAVLDAWGALPEKPFLVIAPRRPERFDSVARIIQSRGLRLLRRSSSIPDSQFAIADSPDVYLLDSIGELASVYRGARLAFIGGTFIATGGHNPIEAWAEGVPVVAGPHMENFREIARAGSSGGFLRQVSDARGLSEEMRAAGASPRNAAERGDRARRFVEGNRGAARRTVERILEILDSRKAVNRAIP